MQFIKNKKFTVLIFLFIILSFIIAILTRISINEESNLSEVLQKLNNYPFYPNYEEDIKMESFKELQEESDIIAIVTPTGDSVILGDSVITKVKVDNILKGECEEYLNIIEPVSLFYENVEEGNLSYVSSINGYNFMKQNKEYIVLLNKANNVDYSDELYVYHNVYLGKFPKAYKDISYKIYDDIDIYKTINSYEQVFDNIEAVNYYKDIYNQIIFEYKIKHNTISLEREGRKCSVYPHKHNNPRCAHSLNSCCAKQNPASGCPQSLRLRSALASAEQRFGKS